MAESSSPGSASTDRPSARTRRSTADPRVGGGVGTRSRLARPPCSGPETRQARRRPGPCEGPPVGVRELGEHAAVRRVDARRETEPSSRRVAVEWRQSSSRLKIELAAPGPRQALSRPPLALATWCRRCNVRALRGCRSTRQAGGGVTPEGRDGEDEPSCARPEAHAAGEAREALQCCHRFGRSGRAVAHSMNTQRPPCSTGPHTVATSANLKRLLVDGWHHV